MATSNFGSKDKFIRGSLVLFVATLGLNISGYLFHVFMGRFLGPADYGILGTLLSMIYLIGISSTVVQLSLSKFVSEFKAKNQEGKINILIIRSYKKLFIFGLVSTFIMIVLTPLISHLLKIPEINVLVLAPSLLLTFLLPINRSILQGLQRFNFLGINLASEGVFKLVFSVVLVWMDLHVTGAILAILLSLLLPIFLGIFQLKDFLTKTKETLETKNIYKYSLPVLFTLVLLTGMYTLDVFMVKYFFSDAEAGYYVAASLLGKIILFISMSITTVLFPQSVELFTLKSPTKNLLKKALLFTLVPSVLITTGYFLLPGLAIFLLFGDAYNPITSIIGPFGIAMSLFSFIYILSLYNLSINRKKFIYFIIGCFFAEIFLIYNFHSTLQQVLFMLNVVLSILLVALCAYTKLVKYE